MTTWCFQYSLFLSLSRGGSSHGKTVVRQSKSSIAVSMRVGHGGGDILHWPGHQDVVAVLSLLQLNQLGIGGGGGLHRLEGGGLVVDGVLGNSGHGVDSVGVGEAGVAAVQQLGGGLDRDSQDRENNLRVSEDQHKLPAVYTELLPRTSCWSVVFSKLRVFLVERD